MLARSLLRSHAQLSRAMTTRVVCRQTRLFTTSIQYTLTDEAPALATYALLPVIRRFTNPAGIKVKQVDISVAARILAQFPERLTDEQKVPDTLAELGRLVKTPEANVIKLPNVSASIPQLHAAIKELQKQGFDVPDYVENPDGWIEEEDQRRYAKVLGSAVNPVLREGNSDRRVAAPVKAYAQKNPHKLGAWSPDSKSRVSHMDHGDFYGSEQSAIIPTADNVKITFHGIDKKSTVLKESTVVLEGEVLDASTMNIKSLRSFLEKEFQEAKSKNLMASLHLKATMMKISDPIMFGHAVTTYYKDLFAKHEQTFKELGVNPNNGFQDVLTKIAKLPAGHRAAIEKDIESVYETRPGLAMVNSAKGITNLHVPSDVIIDASMPVVVRDSGKMWNKHDKLEDVVCIIPDRCYASVYKVIMDDCRKNGQFNVSTMGNVPNVGLMAKKAEEYGSHDKTFTAPADGSIKVTNQAGEVLFDHPVEKGDIWRMCQTKDAPIRDWVKLAINRASATEAPAVFWLDSRRAHDANIIKKVKEYLRVQDTSKLAISIMAPAEAMRHTCERTRAGLTTISVTGNVLRDYLTDLFPILELGTSAKMLSIVPMMAGGAMFETGAGGSAPKHVQQFLAENHLRWDSLGEYLALATSLEDLGRKSNNEVASLLSETLLQATGKVLDNRQSPGRKVGQIDNRGTTFYVALYWAQAMAQRDPKFKELAKNLSDAAPQISKELIDCQGSPVDIGGYYRPDVIKTEKAMRPSELFNKLIAE
eukprot:gb/GEZN01001665.1/.p1 GENE.gb/GEZN01001665.1/~~gb/GEZN01001665.1/.p1  ORF type:complete len:761 (+),score=125.11 gb/GEZN01001665.1/:34-2316(+)